MVLWGASGKMGSAILKMTPPQFEVHSRHEGFRERVHLVMDFSTPDGFHEALKFAVRRQLPFFSGTTGLQTKHLQALQKASTKIPVAQVPNTSPGMNWLFGVLQKFPPPQTQQLEILEAHHAQKRDAPSGTALRLVRLLQREQLRIESRREGDEIGLHEVSLIFSGEILKLSHQVLDRRVFAEGAWTMAQKLLTKKRGNFSGHELLFAK